MRSERAGIVGVWSRRWQSWHWAWPACVYFFSIRSYMDLPSSLRYLILEHSSSPRSKVVGSCSHLIAPIFDQPPELATPSMLDAELIAFLHRLITDHPQDLERLKTQYAAASPSLSLMASSHHPSCSIRLNSFKIPQVAISNISRPFE